MSQRAHKPIPIPLSENATEENLSKSKGITYRRSRVIDQLITTASYVDSEVFDKRLVKTALITVKEIGGVETVYYKILGCIDPSDWHEIQPETSLAAGGHISYSASEPWAYLKLQVKNNSGAGKVVSFISGLTP